MTAATSAQARRFILVGITAVVIDALVTALLRYQGAPPGTAKVVGFISGAVFAYFANLRYTFRAEGSRRTVVLFIAVYLTNLIINRQVYLLAIALQPVLYPALGLDVLVPSFFGSLSMQETIAWFTATGLSAVLNFLGMKLIVFRPQPSRGEP